MFSRCFSSKSSTWTSLCGQINCVVYIRMNKESNPLVKSAVCSVDYLFQGKFSTQTQCIFIDSLFKTVGRPAVIAGNWWSELCFRFDSWMPAVLQIKPERISVWMRQGGYGLMVYSDCLRQHHAGNSMLYTREHNKHSKVKGLIPSHTLKSLKSLYVKCKSVAFSCLIGNTGCRGGTGPSRLQSSHSDWSRKMHIALGGR